MIWEAARATCAAPTYFPRIGIGPPGSQEDFFDGGMGCNNPIKELHFEAESVFEDSREVSCILSIGTGARRANSVETPSLFQNMVLPIQLIKGLKRMALSSDKYAEEMEQKYSRISDLYYRLNVDKGLQGIGLADFNKLGEVRTHTQTYLRQPSIEIILDSIVCSLCTQNKAPGLRYTLAQLSTSTKTIVQATMKMVPGAENFGQSQRRPPSLVSAQSTSAEQKPDRTQETVEDSRKRTIQWLLDAEWLLSPQSEEQNLILCKRFRNEETKYASCDWFFETEEYNKLSNSMDSTVLWVLGPPGSGKTVLASVIVDEARKSGTESVLYCFCHLELGQFSSSTVIRTLLVQALQQTESVIPPDLLLLSEAPVESRIETADSVAKLWDLLHQILEEADRDATVVIDGLDECRRNASPIIHLLKLQSFSSSSSRCKMILLARSDDALIDAFLNQRSEDKLQLRLNQDHTQQDITKFVSFRINSDQSVMRRKPQAMKDEAISKISERSAGMFLHATLVLEDLKAESISSLRAMRKHLEKIPDKLFDIYDSNMETATSSALGPEIIRWLYCTMSDLTWRQLKSGLEIDDLEFSEDNEITESCDALLQFSCGTLVGILDVSKSILGFIHPTVKEYLASERMHTKAVQVGTAHRMVTTKLLIFLNRTNRPNFTAVEEQMFSEVLDQFESKPGAGLYSYAIRNWYKHLKECDAAEDKALEGQLARFLTSKQSVHWLNAALWLTGSPSSRFHSASVVIDATDGLQCWLRNRKIAPNTAIASSVRTWIKDLLQLILDWGFALDIFPSWLDYIDHYFLSSDNVFRSLLGSAINQRAIQFSDEQHLTRSSLITADWLESRFAIDQERELVYTSHGSTIICHQLTTALPVAEIQISIPVRESSVVALHQGLLCPQKRYIALSFKVQSNESDPFAQNIEKGLRIFEDRGKLSWKMESSRNEDTTHSIAQALGLRPYKLFVCLLELHYTGMARTHLIGFPSWSLDGILCSGSATARWSIDEQELLCFSGDSKQLSTPFGLYSVDSGKKARSWDLVDRFNIRGERVTQDFRSIGLVRNRNTIEFIGISDGRTMWAKTFPCLVHILALDSTGRFMLLLKHMTQSTAENPNHYRAGSLDDSAVYHQGVIGIYDRESDYWNDLLALGAPHSKSPSSWNILQPRLWHSFPDGSSLRLGSITNERRVLVKSKNGWTVSDSIQYHDNHGSIPNASNNNIFIFEGQKVQDNFGPYPTLKYQVAVKQDA